MRHLAGVTAHDGNWIKAMETWNALKELQAHHDNLVLTTHTVVSKFNLHRFFEIYTGLGFLEPDSYITEVAESLNRRLARIPFSVVAQVESTIPASDVVALEVGDVVSLDEPVTSEVDVNVSDRRKFHGKLLATGKTVRVRIQRPAE